METKQWNIKTTDIERRILPKARYKCKLVEIRQIQAPVFGKVDEKEEKLVWAFEPDEIPGEPLKDEELCQITAFCRPSSGTKSAMYKLLCQMSPTGSVDEDIRHNRQKYQAFAEAMVGKRYLVTSAPSKTGKHNIATMVIPLEESPTKSSAASDDDIPF